MKINLLKGRMAERGCNAINLATKLGRQPDYVRKRIYHPSDFRLSEVYIICGALEIPFEDIPSFFPKEERTRK